ncbi:hypothetical protein GWK47_044827 [Chionoecetes opilio]|uniref:Reverse transcriptase domain-containing protein n=1 Tax=Chionoecetes opilio TaxID=41210 RepID=A0A8J5CXV7_CHIOP|nr:hypothetical protein GWK47_044827 [Chionoecetes opilio]
MDWVLGKVVDQSDCGASLGNTKITDPVFADGAVIFAESLEVLVMALEALHEEAKPLGLEVSWLKTKVQGNDLGNGFCTKILILAHIDNTGGSKGAVVQGEREHKRDRSRNANSPYTSKTTTDWFPWRAQKLRLLRHSV